MMEKATIKPTVVLPDAAPLKATYYDEKLYAQDVAAWLAKGQEPGSNAPVEIAESDLGPLYRHACSSER